VKTWATESKVAYNIKFGAKGKTHNYAIPFFFSNHLDSIKIDSNDARAFVEITTGKRKDQEYYDKLWGWMESEQGCSAIMEHFLHRDVSHFNPMDIPHNTVSKSRIVEENMSPLGLFIKQNLMYQTSEAPAPDYKGLPSVMYTKHIRNMLHKVDDLLEDREEIDRKELGYALKEAGARQVKNSVRSKVVRGSEGIMKLCILRDFDKWDKLYRDVHRDDTAWRGALRDEADLAFGNVTIVGKIEYMKHKSELQNQKKVKNRKTWKPKIV
ncbi:MAG: hypothetical protein QNJ16_19170, partial [Rhodobacter sp.]|nr:hypothetical protein [Rhodobacter sp.]